MVTWRRVLLIGCCAVSLVRAQTSAPGADQNSPGAAQNDEETVYDIGPGVTPPRVIKQVNPRYSTSKGVRAVGSVIIALVVSSKGMPKDPHVVKGIDTDLDQSAVDAVKEWRFAPAQKNDKPIAVRVSVEIRFHEM
jgi:protein TonB